MGLLDMNKGLNLGNLALGAAAVMFAPIVIPVIGGIIKPVAKAAIKSGIMIYEKGREIAAETRETVEDLAAEVKTEMTQVHEAAMPEKKPSKSKS